MPEGVGSPKKSYLSDKKRLMRDYIQESNSSSIRNSVSLISGELYPNYLVANEAHDSRNLMVFKDAEELISILEFNKEFFPETYRKWEDRIRIMKSSIKKNKYVYNEFNWKWLESNSEKKEIEVIPYVK